MADCASAAVPHQTVTKLHKKLDTSSSGPVSITVCLALLLGSAWEGVTASAAGQGQAAYALQALHSKPPLASWRTSAGCPTPQCGAGEC